MAQSQLLLSSVSGVPLHLRQLVWLLYSALAGAVMWGQRQRAPGWQRAAAALPIVLINLALPLAFNGGEEVLANFAVAIATAFISNLKLVAWIINRGSLVNPSLSFPQFVAIYMLPLTPAEAPEGEEGKSEESTGPAAPGAAAGAPTSTAAAAAGVADSQAKARRPRGRVHESHSTAFMLARFFAKAVGLTFVAHVLRAGRLSGVPLLAAQTFSQVMILSIAADGLGALVSALLGLRVAPHFENTYATTSINEFWSKRWNLVVSNIMRACLYDPIMDGRLVRRPGGPFPAFSPARRMAAVLSVFVLSGLVHEMLFWYQSGRTSPHLLWFWHFSAWGLLCVAENVGKRYARRAGIKLHPVVSALLFQVLLHAMLYVFWFPPLNAMGIMDRGTESIVMGWGWLEPRLRSLAKAPLAKAFAINSVGTGAGSTKATKTVPFEAGNYHLKLMARSTCEARGFATAFACGWQNAAISMTRTAVAWSKFKLTPLAGTKLVNNPLYITSVERDDCDNVVQPDSTTCSNFKVEMKESKSRWVIEPTATAGQYRIRSLSRDCDTKYLGAWGSNNCDLKYLRMVTVNGASLWTFTKTS